MTSQKYSPDDITHPLDVARRALYVGPFTGVFGLTTGALYGTLRTETPVLFSLISGVQCFTLGMTFWGLRTSILNSDGLQNWWYASRGAPLKIRRDLEPTTKEKLRASTMAGALTGFSLGFVFRGPANVIPGTICWSVFGYLGQRGYNYFDARNTAAIERKARGEDEPRESLMYRFAKSKWSPMSILNDEEYEKMMQEKVLHVEAEIALIDDKIAELRKKAAQSRDQGAKKASQTPTKTNQ